MDRWELGAAPLDNDRVRFRLWAPRARRAEVEIEGAPSAQPLARDAGGVFEAVIEGAGPGSRYRYRVDGEPFPDPASRYQPEGVHGPSEVIDLASYRWRDGDWPGRAQDELVFYELHLGTFTPEGTFEAAREKLPYLKELGVTAVELLPVHDFPGRRNWGYDPAAFYAPARCYGRPEELCALIDEAHALGLAVYLDVVYNHTGPDGAYVAGLVPMHTRRHHTNWGAAINLDGEGCEGVRAFLIENALLWLEDYHADGLRLDATFALVDDSEVHFLAELSEKVAELSGPRRILIAEDHRNERRLLDPRPGGYGLDGVWADDFHHLARRLAAGDRHGYYRAYPASPAAVGRALERGFFFTEPPRGTDPAGLEPERFVFCIQNHDQIGNRPAGDRLHHVIDLPLYRALSALLLFAPEIPLLFMGQEWAASTPFLYFTDHNAKLGRLVSEGRRREFEAFPGFSGEVPDPQDETTFEKSVLDWGERARPPHAGVERLYRDLLARRRRLRGPAQVKAADQALLILRGDAALAIGFTAGAEIAIGGRSPIWHSEQDEYAEAPAPPVVEEGLARFSSPAALLLEGPA